MIGWFVTHSKAHIANSDRKKRMGICTRVGGALQILSAPAERNGDGAIFGHNESPKRCRAALATALQRGETLGGVFMKGLFSLLLFLGLAFASWAKELGAVLRDFQEDEVLSCVRQAQELGLFEPTCALN